MSKMNEKELKVYFKKVKKFLPVYSKDEKRYINDLKKSAEEYHEDNENSSYDEFTEHFGEPKDVVSDYISNLDEESLNKKISFRGLILKCVSVILVIALIFYGYKMALVYDVYLHAKEQTITHELTVIE